MSGNRYALTAAALALIAAAGCSSSSSSEPSTGAASSAPIASSSAIANAKAEATACVQKTGANGLLTSSGRTELVDCLKGIVSPARQQAFKDCVTSAAVNDKVWTGDGRSKFINTSVPGCLDTAASATASPT